MQVILREKMKIMMIIVRDLYYLQKCLGCTLGYWNKFNKWIFDAFLIELTPNYGWWLINGLMLQLSLFEVNGVTEFGV